MAVSASARDRFYRKIESFLGPEDAEYLMAALPPDGWAEVATTTEVRELAAGLRTEMADLRGELKTDMAELRAELKTDMAELKTELKTDMSDLRTDMTELRSEMKVEMRGLKTDTAELRSEMKVDLAGIRSEMVTRADLGELLRLHIDGRVGAISRWWMFATMTMQATTVGGIAAALRL